MAERWAILVAVAVVAAGGWYAWQGLHEPLEDAPPFTLTSTGYENGTLGEPVVFSLADYADRTVVLDLMAVNCAACETVARDILVPMHHDPDGPVILSIDTWADPATGPVASGFETRENLIELQAERGLMWRHALDTDEVWRKYQAIALPKLVVVGPEQQIVAEFHGVPSLAEVQRAVDRAQAGGAAPALGVRLPILGLAAVAGVAAFFSPCSVGLVPAYLGLLVRAKDPAGAHRAWTTLQGGVATGAGVLAVYALIAALLFAAGGWLARHLGTIQVVTGFGLIVVGALMFRPGAWDVIARRLGLGRIDGRRGFFAFGLGYGLASFGCTGPAFLPILVGAFALSTGLGITAMAVYGSALVILLGTAAALVAAGQGGRLQHLLSNSRWISRAAAGLFVFAGIYVLWFHYRATGSLF